MSNNTIWEDKPSLLLMLGSTVFALIFCAAGIYIETTYVKLLNPIHAYSAGAGLFFIMTIGSFLSIMTTSYELNSERFIVRRGILTRYTDDLELYRVKDYTVVQPLLLRIFGYGNVVLHTSDQTSPTVIISGITEAEDVKEKIRNLVEKARDAKGVREMDV